MLSVIFAYLCIPQRFRFIARIFVAVFVLAVVAMVLVLFARVLATIPQRHGAPSQSRSHKAVPSEYSRRPSNSGVTMRRVHAD